MHLCMSICVQVPVNVKDQIKNLELLGYSADRKRPPLQDHSDNVKPQHVPQKQTAGAA